MLTISFFRSIYLYPNGDMNNDGTEYISFYLTIEETNKIPYSWEVDVNYEVFVCDKVRKMYLTIQGKNKKKFLSNHTNSCPRSFLRYFRKTRLMNRHPYTLSWGTFGHKLGPLHILWQLLSSEYRIEGLAHSAKLVSYKFKSTWKRY